MKLVSAEVCFFKGDICVRPIGAPKPFRVYAASLSTYRGILAVGTTVKISAGWLLAHTYAYPEAVARVFGDYDPNDLPIHIVKVDTPPTNPEVPCNGYKQDSGKVDYTLLMQDMAVQVHEIASLLHWGHHVKGYPREGYKTLPDARQRLLAATYRHLSQIGPDMECLDEESGKRHLAHAATNLLMLLSTIDSDK